MPKLTLLGCAPSEFIDYDQWYRRDVELITSNQCGNVVLEISGEVIDVYIENEAFAKSRGRNTSIRNGQGYIFLSRLTG
jgi:competence protein ComEC